MWASVKITTEMAKEMKKLKAKGMSYNGIAKIYDVSRNGVRNILDKNFRAKKDEWMRKHPESHRVTPETRKRIYKRKIKLFGPKYRSYQNQFVTKHRYEKAHLEK